MFWKKKKKDFSKETITLKPFQLKDHVATWEYQTPQFTVPIELWQALVRAGIAKGLIESIFEKHLEETGQIKVTIDPKAVY